MVLFVSLTFSSLNNGDVVQPPVNEAKVEDLGSPKKEIDDVPYVPKRVPISLEELIAKRKAEEAELIKPKFISKEERIQQAIQRRQAEVQAQREKQIEAFKKQTEYLEGAKGYTLVYCYAFRSGTKETRRRFSRKNEAAQKL